MRPAQWDAANRWGLADLGHPIQSIYDLYQYWRSSYPLQIQLNDNYWVPRVQGTATFPKTYTWVQAQRVTWLRNEGTPMFLIYGWPQRLHDLAAPYVPFVSDTAGSGNGGGLIMSPSGVGPNPSQISPNTGHFQSGIFNPINLGYADGHVANHNLAQMRCVYQDVNSGSTYWFY